MRIIDVQQGTPEWLAARAGKVTASRIADVMAKGKSGGESASRAKYRAQVVTEILTGRPAEQTFKSAAMDRGNEKEPEARAATEAKRGILISQVGVVLHPESDRAAASPDGLVNWDGESDPEVITQFKCPETHTHMEYLLTKKVPTDYFLQMQWEMRCTGAKRCLFVSFDDRVPEFLHLSIVEVERDDAKIKEIEAEVEKFNKEVDEMLERLCALAEEEA